MLDVSKTKAVFFDLGNTIVNYHIGDLTDDEKDSLGLLNMYKKLKQWNVDISCEVLYNDFFIKWMKKLKYRKNKAAEYDIKDFLYHFLPLRYRSDKYFSILMRIFQEPCARFSVLENGLDKFLEYLNRNNVIICLISNSPVPGFCHDETLKKHNIFHYFKYRFYSYDLEVRKPDLRIFDLAIKKIKVKPDNVVMIGDSLKLDIEPALRLGIRALLYNPKNKDVNYSNVFKSYKDLYE